MILIVKVTKMQAQHLISLLFRTQSLQIKCRVTQYSQSCFRTPHLLKTIIKILRGKRRKLSLMKELRILLNHSLKLEMTN